MHHSITNAFIKPDLTLSQGAVINNAEGQVLFIAQCVILHQHCDFKDETWKIFLLILRRESQFQRDRLLAKHSDILAPGMKPKKYNLHPHSFINSTPCHFPVFPGTFYSSPLLHRLFFQQHISEVLI